MKAQISFEVDMEPGDAMSLVWMLDNGYVSDLEQYSGSINNTRVELIPEEGS